MKWNDAEIYFAGEATNSGPRHWDMQKDDSGKYALIREEKLVGVFNDTASAIEEGHRRFGSNFLVREISDSSEEVCLGVLPAFPDEDAGT